jgi:hypothetical protein
MKAHRLRDLIMIDLVVVLTSVSRVTSFWLVRSCFELSHARTVHIVLLRLRFLSRTKELQESTRYCKVAQLEDRWAACRSPIPFDQTLVPKLATHLVPELVPGSSDMSWNGSGHILTFVLNNLEAAAL